MNKADRASSDDESDDASITTPPAFSGYRPFPPVMNLFANYSVNLIKTMTTAKLCGADESDFLYLAEVHLGYTSRGPLDWKPGMYLRNGTTKKGPIFAAAGDTSAQPLLLVSTFKLDSAIMLPPLDLNANPLDLITEIMHASTASTQDHVVAFRFSVEVGVKGSIREDFEWRKNKSQGADTRSRYTLIRLPSTSQGSSSPAAHSSTADDGGQTVAELVFANMTSMKHIFTLELKGAGCSGELGDRWALMVVMTALRLWWLRQYGKTRKGTVVAAEKIHRQPQGKETTA